MEENSLVKQDINFLEFPNWVLNEKNRSEELIIEKDHGTYKLTTQADSLPTKTDKVVLYYLLLKVFESKKTDNREVITSRYKIAKDVFCLKGKPGKTSYDRLWLSLKRWHKISVEFQGVFYESEEYTQRLFHIIDDVIFDKKTKQIKLRFNQEYLDQLKESNFCKYINYDEYKRLRKPISARFYEIIVKTFKERSVWKIEILKLKEKLTLSEKYPSDLLKKIKPSIKEINEKTELKIKFDYNQESGVCTFTKFDNAELISISKKKVQENETVNIPEKYINMLPLKQRRKEIYKVIASFILKGADDDFLSSNISYTTEKAKTNFLKFLKLSLHNDYAKNEREEKAKTNEIENEKKKKAAQQEKLAQENERIEREKKQEENDHILALIKQLPEHHYKDVEMQAETMVKKFPAPPNWTNEKLENWKKNFMVDVYKGLRKTGKI